MNLTQRQCKVTVLDEVIEQIWCSIRDGGSEEMQTQRRVVIAELNHQAKRLQRKLPGMKEDKDK